MKEDDNNWPEPDRVGRQELEIVMGNEHISFTTSKIGSLVDVQSSKDPEGLRIFYYLVQVSFLLLLCSSGGQLISIARFTPPVNYSYSFLLCVASIRLANQIMFLLY